MQNSAVVTSDGISPIFKDISSRNKIHSKINRYISDVTLSLTGTHAEERNTFQFRVDEKMSESHPVKHFPSMPHAVRPDDRIVGNFVFSILTLYLTEAGCRV